MSAKKTSNTTDKNDKATLGEKGEFTIGLSNKRLKDIVNNKMREVSFDVPESSYEQLSEENKRALSHLVKAATILDKVFLKQDHADNIRAKEAFEKAVAQGNETAEMAYKLFTSFNGLEGKDMYAKQSKPLRVFKDKKLQPGKGFYPQDITRKELISYVLKHPEQASAIFSNNTIVKRDGEKLTAVPYSVAYREEMEGAARELLEAARETDHEGFASYLRWQAQALVNDSDAELLYRADKAWINLEDSPLEFTVQRESYEDRLSSDVTADPKVKAMLESYGIKAKSKDSIGARVGIVNQESYAAIANYRQHLEDFGRRLPLHQQYAKADENDNESKMSFADVDLVAFTGDYAAVRGGITVAQNLPNDDKLAVQLGEGSRLVFHRQVRQSGDPEQQKKFLNALIDPAQHKWHDDDADFLFTVGHELVHSLGPQATTDGRDKKNALGKWGDIIEENKADVGSILMTDYLKEVGQFDDEQANKIYLTWAAKELPNKQPSEDEAHRYRSIMQLNYFREKGAIQFEKGGKLSIVPEKMADAAKQMLEEVIQLQLDGDAAKAGAFVKKYGAWNEALQYAADEQMKLKPKLYRIIEEPLKNKLLAATPKP